MTRKFDVDRLVVIRAVQERAAQSAAQLAATELTAGEAAQAFTEAALAEAQTQWQAFTRGQSFSPQGIIAHAHEVVKADGQVRTATQTTSELRDAKTAKSEAWLWAQTRTRSAEDLAKQQRKRDAAKRDEQRLHDVMETFHVQDGS